MPCCMSRRGGDAVRGGGDSAMTDSVRIFISFAEQDEFARDELIEEAIQSGTRCVFTEMVGKDSRNPEWRAKCRSEVRSCDGVIAFISRHTPEAGDACWAIGCAREAGVPIRGFWVHHDETRGKPFELGDTPVVYWSWDNIVSFIHSLGFKPRSAETSGLVEMNSARKQIA